MSAPAGIVTSTIVPFTFTWTPAASTVAMPRISASSTSLSSWLRVSTTTPCRNLTVTISAEPARWWRRGFTDTVVRFADSTNRVAVLPRTTPVILRAGGAADAASPWPLTRSFVPTLNRFVVRTVFSEPPLVATTTARLPFLTTVPRNALASAAGATSSMAATAPRTNFFTGIPLERDRAESTRTVVLTSVTADRRIRLSQRKVLGF